MKKTLSLLALVLFLTSFIAFDNPENKIKTYSFEKFYSGKSFTLTINETSTLEVINNIENSIMIVNGDTTIISLEKAIELEVRCKEVMPEWSVQINEENKKEIKPVSISL